MTGSRVLVVGLDGATWDVIFPLLQEGKLPNLKYLIDGGMWGYLNSTNPPMTLPSWSSMLTGCNPGKHGIFDFVDPSVNFAAIKTGCVVDNPKKLKKQDRSKNHCRSKIDRKIQQ